VQAIQKEPRPALTPVPSVRRVLPPITAERRGGAGAVRRWIRRSLVLAAIVATVVVLRFTYFRPVAIPVTVTEVRTGRVEDLVTNNKAGTITARRQAALSPEFGGRIVALPVDAGARVRRGDVLIAVADADVRAQLTLEERSLDAVRSAAAEACANAEFAVRDLDRVRRLVSAGALSQQDLDRAITQQAATKATCDAATSRASQTAAGVDVARVNLGKTVLRAPFDAIVTKVNAHLGEWIMPSPAGLPMPPAVELVDVRSIYVKAPLDEVDASRATVGLPVRITMDAYPGRAFPGMVTRVGAYVSEAQQQNRTLDIDVAFDDAAFAQTLLPGLSADVEVIVQKHDDVVRVPTSAILQGGRVLIVRDSTLVQVTVRTGLTNWEFSEIVDGLKAGDLIVVSLDRPEVRAGAHVRIESEAGK
jgi:HlyD family secretion protein